MKKLKYMVKYGLKKRLMTKAFVISTAIIGVLILAVTLLPTILSSFGNDEGSKIEGNIIIVDTTQYTVFTSTLKDKAINELRTKYTVDVNITVKTSLEDIPNESFYENPGDVSGIVYIYLEPYEAQNPIKIEDNFIVRVKVFNVGIDSILLSKFEQEIIHFQRIKYLTDHGNVDPNFVSDIFPEYVVNPYADNNPMEGLIAGLTPMLIIPVFILITFAVQVIGTDILEEKSTKAIEIVIASVKPQTHFIAKILSIIIFQFVQLAIYFSFGILGVLLNNLIAGQQTGGASWGTVLGELAPVVGPTLGLVFVCSILGATIYAIIGAFIASLAVNQEDYQQVQTPVMLLLMIAYMGSLFAGAFESKAVLLVFSYIPFFSPLVLPIVYAIGAITMTDVIIGMVILVITIAVLIVVLGPLYRASILSYDQSNLFKRIKNTYKTAKALKQNQKSYEEKNGD